MSPTADKKIVFLESPRDSSLVSGGYRYNAEIGRRLESTGLGVLVDVDPTSLAASAPEAVQKDSDSVLVFDSLYMSQLDPPAWVTEVKSRVRLLLHYLPSLNPLLEEAAAAKIRKREQAWIDTADGVLTTSAHLAELVLEHFDVKAQIATPGVGACFRAVSSSREAGQGNGRAFVVSVGPITREKGQLDTARAMAASAGANPGRMHWLTLVGDETADPEYTEQIRSAAEGYELVFTGCLPSEGVANELSKADLFVSASVFESYGMAIAEAAATGTPVASYRVGEVDRWVKDGVNGYLIDPGFGESLTELVVRLFEDSTHLRDLHGQGQELFFPSWEFTFKRFLRGCHVAGGSGGTERDNGPSLYSSCDLPTRFGTFAVKVYRLISGEEAIVIAMGDLTTPEPPFVRVHSECFTGEILHSLKCDCRLQIEVAMQAVGERKRGAIVYLRQEGRGIGLGNKIRAYAEQSLGADTVEANERLGFPADMREFRAAAEILKLEGVECVQLNTNNPDKVTSLEAHGVKVVNVVPSRTLTNPHNIDYLLTKFHAMGHAGLLGALLHQDESNPGLSALGEPSLETSWSTGIVGTSRPEALAQLRPNETLLIVDLDGVIKLDTGIAEEACELLDRLRSKGYTVRFLTNDGINSRRSRCVESARDGMEMNPDELYTASYLTARYLEERAPGAILPLFGEQAGEEFQSFETSLTSPSAVVVGDYFPHYDYEILKAAYSALESGAELVAMHKKRTWPTEGKRVIDIGFWVAGLEYCAGRPATVIGKPGAFAYEVVMADTGFTASQTVMISDEDDPDLLGARQLGLHTVCFQGVSPTATAAAESYRDIAMLFGLESARAGR